MKFNVIITDKNESVTTISVNAVSHKHALSKAVLYSVRNGIWKKRIVTRLSEHDNVNSSLFPLVKL